jgi:hypothetical protein
MNIKKNIIISIPIVWSVRNFIDSEIYKLINNKFDVYYLVPKEGKNLMLDKLGVKENNLIFYDNLNHNLFKAILKEGLQNKFKKKKLKKMIFLKF